MEAIEDFFEVMFKNGFMLLLFLALFFAAPILFVGFKGIFEAVYEYLFTGKSEESELLLKMLHALEFFFIAPLPALIIFSYKEYISAIFPLPEHEASVVAEDKKSEAGQAEAPESAKPGAKQHKLKALMEISPEVAEKAFVSSLIGVTSSFLLSKIVQSFDHDYIINSTRLLSFLLLLVFLVVEILYLRNIDQEKE